MHLSCVVLILKIGGGGSLLWFLIATPILPSYLMVQVYLFGSGYAVKPKLTDALFVKHIKIECLFTFG